MGFYSNHDPTFTVYDIPKGGGSTIRSWIAYYHTGKRDINHTSNRYVCNGPINNLGYNLDWFKDITGEKICVKRDPVDRFISCYNDKIIRENWMQYGGYNIKPPDINNFVDNFEFYVATYDTKHPTAPHLNYLCYHFAPTYKILGEDLNYYDNVFNMWEISSKLKNYLEDKWNIELPPNHLRKQNTKSVELSNDSIQKIKDMYRKDYELGWY